MTETRKLAAILAADYLNNTAMALRAPGQPG
jgi:hypothetical protein